MICWMFGESWLLTFQAYNLCRKCSAFSAVSSHVMNIIWIDVIEANRMKIETKRLRARELFEYKRKMVYNFTGSNFFEIQKPTSQ